MAGPGAKQQSQLGDALSLLAAGRIAEAKPILEKLTRRSPAPRQALYNLGQILKMEGNTQKAATLFKRAAIGAEPYPQAEFELAAIDMEAGRLKQARERFESLLPFWPDDGDLLINLARICERQGDLEAATGYLAKAGEDEEGTLAASLHFRAGEIEQAYTALRGLPPGEAFKRITTSPCGSIPLDEAVFISMLKKDR